MTMMAMAAVPCLCARPSLRGVARLCPNATARGVAAVRAAVVEAAAVVEEDAAVKERYALGGACRVLAGMPAPLGATALAGGVNFAVYSGSATAAALCLFTPDDLKENRVTGEVLLDPVINRTGTVWHVFVEGELHHMLYGYRFDGTFAPQLGQYLDASNIVVDPYAKAVISRGEYGVPAPDGDCWPQMAGMIPLPYNTFDWQGDLPLRYPQKDLVIYEMHLRGFTKHDSSNVEHPGTFIGAVSKLDYLKELGVNCVELMPCHEFNELEYSTSSSKVNFWGYSTINFFSPMMRYTSGGINNCGRDAINEFKTFVREAHKQGIEVILDVVFNHTAEGNENGPILSFRGIDNSTYYMLAPKGEFYNYSGCGNTFNCNHPVVREFIVDCLRYWVTEMHVDGFRFDLASIMTRGSSLWDPVNVYGAPMEGDMITTGTPLVTPPLVDMISNDPILGGVKLIAEAWDAGGLYQVGQFPHWNIWSEWNGKYRDIVRQFIKGTDGFSGGFAECLCGSPRVYQEGGRKPWHSINFVCAHDGFTLADLVTYNNKYNLSNGENNGDGENHNLSWNCGEEGEFARLSVRRLRKRQMRNFFVCLMVSQGVPMFYMGDEYGHTKSGNNNTYCHDNYVNYFRWDKKEESYDLHRFCRLMTKFRKECESLGLEDFPTAERLQWHGHQPGKPDWSETSRFVAFSMRRTTTTTMHPRGGGERAAVRKGPWTAEEDELLRQHVREHGPREWSSIRSKGLLPRTGKSCRLRWVNKLRPNLKTGCKFSAEEERVVIELQAQFGNKWARISTYLPGRTDNDVKNFWSTRQKRLARILRAPLSRRRPAAAKHCASTSAGGAPSSSSAAASASHDQPLRAPKPEPLCQDQVPRCGTMIPFQETPMHIGESSQEPPLTASHCGDSPFPGLLDPASIMPSPIGFAAMDTAAVAGCSSSYGAAPEAHYPLSLLYAGDPAPMIDASGFVDTSALVYGGVAYLEPKRELEQQQQPAGFFGLEDDDYGHIVPARRGAPDVLFDDLAPEMFDFFELPSSPPPSPSTRP